MNRRDTDHARRTQSRSNRGDEGFLMAAVLVGMAVTAIWMSAMLPTWRQQAQRQREEDLIFRGEQYARAIALFATRNNGALPTSIDDLVRQRYLRKKWKDPITGKDFMLLGTGAVAEPGAGGGAGRGGSQPLATPSPQQSSGPVAAGIRGVYSESTDTSIRTYNTYQQYNQWIFDYQTALLKMGRLGAGGPGQSAAGRGGREAGPGGARGGRGATELQPIRGARGGRGDQVARPGQGRGGGAGGGRGAGS